MKILYAFVFVLLIGFIIYILYKNYNKNRETLIGRDFMYNPDRKKVHKVNRKPVGWISSMNNNANQYGDYKPWLYQHPRTSRHPRTRM